MLVDVGALPQQVEAFDVVVIGAGGAGMAAALFAAIDGARVLIVERTRHVGGTTAWSGGTTWIPGTHHAKALAPDDTIAAAARYLDAAIGDRTPAALRQAFLDAGPEAVAFIEANSEVRFRAYPLHPDYISELPGSTLKGRALEPLPFDGRKLGPLLPLVRPPIPEFTVLRGMMVDRTDIFHLLRMTKTLVSFRHSARILARHLRDRMRHPRGTRLVMGNALVGRLLHSLAQRPNVALAIEATVEAIQRDARGVHAVTLVQRGQRRTVDVRGGVVLASGGFNRHPELRARMLPGIAPEWCPGAPGHTGAAHDLARGLGAHYGRDATSLPPDRSGEGSLPLGGTARSARGAHTDAFWAPVSIRPRPDGSTAVFPHFLMDRAKPGMLTVNRAGQRFVNESTSYHLFAIAMQEAHRSTPSIPAYLIADAGAVRRYGIGMVRPGGKGLAPFIADGYLASADSLAALAAKLGIDAQALEATVARFNASAEAGIDADFGRGTTAYQRNLGDAAWPGTNPCLGPLVETPFYAVRLYPGDIGAATGFETDRHARVLDDANAPIPGLYAVGNDMHSVMGGVYTGPGITIGPGLVFGSIAARHASARARGGKAPTTSIHGEKNERHAHAER